MNITMFIVHPPRPAAPYHTRMFTPARQTPPRAGPYRREKREKGIKNGVKNTLLNV